MTIPAVRTQNACTHTSGAGPIPSTTSLVGSPPDAHCAIPDSVDYGEPDWR